MRNSKCVCFCLDQFKDGGRIGLAPFHRHQGWGLQTTATLILTILWALLPRTLLTVVKACIVPRTLLLKGLRIAKISRQEQVSSDRHESINQIKWFECWSWVAEKMLISVGHWTSTRSWYLYDITYFRYISFFGYKGKERSPTLSLPAARPCRVSSDHLNWVRIWIRCKHL